MPPSRVRSRAESERRSRETSMTSRVGTAASAAPSAWDPVCATCCTASSTTRARAEFETRDRSRFRYRRATAAVASVPPSIPSGPRDRRAVDALRERCASRRTSAWSEHPLPAHSRPTFAPMLRLVAASSQKYPVLRCVPRCRCVIAQPRARIPRDYYGHASCVSADAIDATRLPLATARQGSIASRVTIRSNRQMRRLFENREQENHLT
jgi:hypothetical protein